MSGTGRNPRPEKQRPKGTRPNAPKFTPRTPKGTTFKKPPLEPFTTTLWDYPSQHYGDGKLQGDPNYVGATPGWVVWQLLTRYTEEGDVVVDPMCGSGTTLDVCKDLNRKGRGFDLAPRRGDIERADARELPLPDGVADFVFVDPPYSTHVDYSQDPDCIGKLDAGGADGGRAYYEAMAAVIAEIDRVLKRGGHCGLYVSDSARGQEFMPIGFELFAMLCERFEPVDHVAVVRRNRKLAQGGRNRAAKEGSALQRGFNHLFVMRKPGKGRGRDGPRTLE